MGSFGVALGLIVILMGALNKPKPRRSQLFIGPSLILSNLSFVINAVYRKAGVWGMLQQSLSVISLLLMLPGIWFLWRESKELRQKKVNE